jgi:nicotinate dehydrogenase subunit B
VASLIGGKRFSLKVSQTAPLKPPATYTVVGKPILRTDVPAKCTGRHVYVQDFTLPGMLHGRVIRPPAIGAKLLTVNESSTSGIPDVRVVRIESFPGVVAKDEWAAIRGARELKATRTEWQELSVSEGLDRHMRDEPVETAQPAVNRGDTAAAMAASAKQLASTYYWHFHSHASLGPSCVVADFKESGTTIWSSTQDAYGLRSILTVVEYSAG